MSTILKVQGRIQNDKEYEGVRRLNSAVSGKEPTVSFCETAMNLQVSQQQSVFCPADWLTQILHEN